MNKQKNNDNFISSVKKAYLLYSDYTMATDPDDKEAFLEILSTYIYGLNDHKTTLMYFKICDSSEDEKETYTEILGDILSNLAEKEM